MKNSKDKLPIFPEGLSPVKADVESPVLKLSPDRIIVSVCHAFETNEVRARSDIEQICRWIFYYPEHKFYLFLNEGVQENREIIHNLEKNGILAPTTEMNFFKHPSGRPKDYIRLNPNKIAFDWEKEVIEKGPKYIRIELNLSERKKRKLEIKEKINGEKEANSNPLELKPNFMGIGIDLNKVLRWLKKRFSKVKV